MRPFTFLVAVLAVAPFSSVTAQEQPPPVKVGDRVRVTAPDMGIRNRDGTLRLLDTDSLVMRPEYGAPSRLVIPLASLTRFEVRRGGKSHALLGLGIGLVVGAGVGALVGANSDCNSELFGQGFCTTAAAAGGAVVGLVLGLVVGAAMSTDDWDEVPLDQLRVSFVPQRDGRFGLGLSVTF